MLTHFSPGVYPRVPDADYFSIDAASQTCLRMMRDRTAAHAREAMVEGADGSASKAFNVGTASHLAIFQESEFRKRVHVKPAGGFATKVGKEWREAILESAPDAVFVSEEEMETVLGIRAAVMEHPLASALFLEGDSELTVVWEENRPAGKISLKGRFDHFNPKHRAIVDLKTTEDAGYEAFGRSVWNYGYHTQGGHYRRGARANGLDCDHYLIVAVEKGKPSREKVAVYRVKEYLLDAAEAELVGLYDRWAACAASGRWDGYGESVLDLDLPEWAIRRMEV